MFYFLNTILNMVFKVINMIIYRNATNKEKRQKKCR